MYLQPEEIYKRSKDMSNKDVQSEYAPKDNVVAWVCWFFPLLLLKLATFRLNPYISKRTNITENVLGRIFTLEGVIRCLFWGLIKSFFSNQVYFRLEMNMEIFTTLVYLLGKWTYLYPFLSSGLCGLGTVSESGPLFHLCISRSILFFDRHFGR